MPAASEEEVIKVAVEWARQLAPKGENRAVVGALKSEVI
jgi:hypothetical protein